MPNMANVDRRELLEALWREPIVNVHSHHLPDEAHRALNLQSLLEHSYVGWCTPSIPDGTDRIEAEAWLNAVRTRSYFVWLERALRSLYGLDAPLRYETWGDYDAAIRRAHADPDWHLRMLREHCKYEAILLDAFWSPGSDGGHPELFLPAYRINSFFPGYSREKRDHNGHNFRIDRGLRVRDLDEYIACVDAELDRRHAGGAPVLKCALAYDRSLRFGSATREQARRAMADDPAPEDVAAFQDYLFGHICERAAELNMPVQIHTGLGLMRDSHAMSLQPAIDAHPETRFILMHGSYPWTADVTGLAHNYANVWVDLCWLPLISTAAAHRFLHELIDVCNADRIVWGCDTWTGEESFGAKSAFLEVLSRVLAERVEAGLMAGDDALPFARRVLRENALHGILAK